MIRKFGHADIGHGLWYRNTTCRAGGDRGPAVGAGAERRHITLVVHARSLHLHVDDAEFARRPSAWIAPEPQAVRGYATLYMDHMMQADRGAEFDFLVGKTGSPVPRDNH